jgi:hypothetical protein
LPLNDRSVEDPPAVVDCDVAQQLDLARLGIDIDDGQVRAVRNGRHRRVVLRCRGEAALVVGSLACRLRDLP